MMSVSMKENFPEKYMPKTFDEIVGQDEAVNRARAMVAERRIPNMLFAGEAGVGKTSLARVIARELGLYPHSYLELNASDERGIAVIREKVKRFARILGARILFLDEADNLTPDAQDALRAIMAPENKSDCIFILTANRIWKIIEPIQSRCVRVVFKPLESATVFQRLLDVCNAEGLDIYSDSDSKDQLMEIVRKCRGDLRKALSMLEFSIESDRVVRTLLEDPQSVMLAALAVRTALEGDINGALTYIEDDYIFRGASIDALVESMHKETLDIEDDQRKAWLLAKLGDFEFRCRQGGMPLIHMSAFLGYCWIAPHLSRCPILEGR